MGRDLGDLQRIGLKLFAADGASVNPRQLVPIFHRWIQTQAIADQLLVDVADYAHVPDGPGVMLVAHEGNFSLDLGGGRMGLAYNRKTPMAGGLEERLRLLVRTVLDACLQLEVEPALEGRLRFRGDELQLFANDRLRAPNEPQTLAAFQPALAGLLRMLYGAPACTVTPEPDRRERFGVHIQAPAPVSPRELLGRLLP
jgi:hypothetical protein